MWFTVLIIVIFVYAAKAVKDSEPGGNTVFEWIVK
jgi:hypothetical protein